MNVCEVWKKARKFYSLKGYMRSRNVRGELCQYFYQINFKKSFCCCHLSITFGMKMNAENSKKNSQKSHWMKCYASFLSKVEKVICVGKFVILHNMTPIADNNLENFMSCLLCFLNTMGLIQTLSIRQQLKFISFDSQHSRVSTLQVYWISQLLANNVKINMRNVHLQRAPIFPGLSFSW
jgi:hypothetical protein